MPASAKSSRYVEIEGDYFRVIRQEVEREGLSSELLSVLKRSQVVDTGVLPTSCCYYHSSKRDDDARVQIFCCQFPPQIARIQFQGVDVGETDRTLRNKLRIMELAWPWTLLSVKFASKSMSSVFMHGLKGPLKDGGTRLYRIPMPNIGTGGSFCLGEFRSDAGNAGFAERVNRVMDFIRESVWNNDLWPVLGKDRMSTPNISSLRDWAEWTKKEGIGVGMKLTMQSSSMGCFNDLMTSLRGYTE